MFSRQLAHENEQWGSDQDGSIAYTIRMNHTYLPSNRQLLNTFDILPDTAYKAYWFFVNLQLSLDRCA